MIIIFYTVLMHNLVDAHNHIFSPIIEKSIFNTYNFNGILEVPRVFNGYINIGIHPLYVGDNIDWCYIRKLLESNTNINIGEIGLDKRGDKIRQKEVFKRFIALGEEYNRTLSVHCVKSWGLALDLLKGYKGRILFHRFSSSVEILKELLLFDSFFSFNHRQINTKDMLLLKRIPIDRVLVETDLQETDLHTVDKSYSSILEKTYSYLAKVVGISFGSFCSIIEENFDRFSKKEDI